MTKRKGKALHLAHFVIIFILIIAIAVSGVIFYKNPHYLFIANEHLGLSCKHINLIKTTVRNTADYTLEELGLMDNVIFNQSLMLINNDNMLKEDFIPQVSEYKDTTVFMNDCMKESYSQLSAAVKEKTKDNLYVISDFRTSQQQKEEYEKNPNAIKPGASEHQAGLALDVYVSNFAGEAFVKSKAGRYVNSKCYEYGFIIRYPSYKQEITQIGYEPWHIRYVGEPHAKIIYNNHLTLEEYISSLSKGVWYKAEGCLISRQAVSDEKSVLSLPENLSSYSSVTISPDNMGNYIITIIDQKQ